MASNSPGSLSKSVEGGAGSWGHTLALAQTLVRSYKNHLEMMPTEALKMARKEGLWNLPSFPLTQSRFDLQRNRQRLDLRRDARWGRASTEVCAL